MFVGGKTENKSSNHLNKEIFLFRAQFYAERLYSPIISYNIFDINLKKNSENILISKQSFIAKINWCKFNNNACYEMP